MLILTTVLALGLFAVAMHRTMQPGQSLWKPAFTAEGPTDAHNLRAIWLTACVAALYVRPVSSAVDQVAGVPGIAAAVMFALMAIGSGELLMALRCVTASPEQARQGRAPRAAALLTVVAVLFLSVLTGRPPDGDLTQRWGSGGSLLWMALFWGSWLVWCGTAGLRAAASAHRFAGKVPNATTATSLRFLTVGGGALFVYATVKSVVIATVILGATPPALLTAVTVGAVTVMGVAAALTSAWPLLAARRTRRGTARALCEVRPLWVRLSTLDEGLVLTPFPSDPSRLSGQDASVALYRACLEIVDWMLILGERLPSGAWERACTAAEPLSDDQRVRAAAGWIRAGLRRDEVGPGHTSAVPELPSGSVELQDFVLAVARVPDSEAAPVANAVENMLQEVSP